MIRHWLLATGKHALHEPYIYNFYDSVICEDHDTSRFAPIERLRKLYRKDRQIRELHVLGAPSKQEKRSFSDIARNGGTPARDARMLYRLAHFLQAKEVLELGTSLGLTSLYLSEDPTMALTTLEGDELLAAEAQQNFNRFERKNIRLVIGNIDDTLEPALQRMRTTDLIYIDANHRYEATLRYFENILEYIHLNTVVVFDDIHWSEEMSAAWNEICNHKKVTLSVDLYRMGLVFFRPFRQKYFYRLERRS